MKALTKRQEQCLIDACIHRLSVTRIFDGVVQGAACPTGGDYGDKTLYALLSRGLLAHDEERDVLYTTTDGLQALPHRIECVLIGIEALKVAVRHK